MQRHPLECDGILPIYSYLSRKTKTQTGCHLVRIPDTVVYDHGIPTGWFHSMQHDCADLSGGILREEYIVKRTLKGKGIDAEKIAGFFGKPVGHIRGVVVEVVATFMHMAIIEGVPTTVTRFLGQQELEQFVACPVKPDGILQKFVMPKGDSNCVLMAVWSPIVCLVRSRRNLTALTERSVTLFERTATYEGRDVFSSESNCSPMTTELVQRHCEAIVSHINAVEGIRISRLIAYFKLDPDNVLWLLWSTGIRLEGENSHPLDVGQRFHTPPEVLRPLTDVLRPSQEERSADRLHTAHLHSPLASPPRRTSPARRKGGPAGDGSSPTEGDGGGATTGLDDAGVRERQERQLVLKINALRNEWWLVNDVFAKRYQTIVARRDFALGVLGDMQYEASTPIRLGGVASPKTFTYQLPADLMMHLGGQGLDALITVLHARREAALVEGDCKISRPLEITLDTDSVGAVTHCINKGRLFITELIDKAIVALKCEAWPFVEQRVVALVMANEIKTSGGGHVETEDH